MQSFDVPVVAHFNGKPPAQKMYCGVRAENETLAAELAKLLAREEFPGCQPISYTVKPAGSAFAQDPATNQAVPVEGETVSVAASETAEPDDLQPERQISRRPFAEWKNMPWFRLRAYARKAVHGQGIEVPDKITALRLLQERNLVAP